MLSGIGFSEILVVLLAMVLLVKPEEIPALMRKAGVATAYLQSFWRGMVEGWKEKAGL